MKKLRILFISGLFVLAFCLLAACSTPRLSKPANLTITNKTLSWDAVDNARGYTVDINGVQQDVRRTSYSFEGTRLEEGSYTFKVKARGNEIDYVDSDWATVTYVQGYESGISYSLDENGKAYIVDSVGIAKGDIVIEDTYNGLPVVEIKGSAFMNSLGTTSVVIGKNVSKIGARAFYGCTEMKSVVIPEGVKVLDEMVFQSCYSLTEITIPDSVTTLGTSAFSYCRGLKNVYIGKGLTTIGDDAFKNCTSLKSITVAGKEANAAALETVTIPAGVKSIGEEAFRNCTSVEALVIDSIVKADEQQDGAQPVESNALTISASAFRDCTSLSSVNLGNREMAIGEYMFTGCTALTGINMTDNITAIGEYAFSGCTSLADVAIGSGVKSVGVYAFYNTEILKDNTDRIRILDGWIIGTDNSTENLLANADVFAIQDADVVGIADYAFSNCIGLTNITLPKNVVYVGQMAFANCVNLMFLTVSDKVVSIGYGAFRNCISLIQATLGKNVETIEAYAFANCSNLRGDAVTMYNKITSIGTYAFYKTALWNMSVEDGTLMVVGDWVVGCPTGLSGNVVIPDGIVGIADYAFAYCAGLTQVTLPSSLRYLGAGAFYYCYNIDPIYGVPLLEVVIPEDCAITEIKPFTFYGAAILTIDIPESVTKIGYSAFGGSTLFQVTIPDSVTEIDSFAFWACPLLSSVTLSKNITYIADRAFSASGNLKSIVIPSKVTYIGERAFFRCSKLSSVTFEGDLVESIGDKAFYMTSSLKSITLPANVTEIGDYAFYKSGLRSIQMRNDVKTIGDFAFFGCESLRTVNLSANLVYIGESAFRYCTNLKSLTLGRSVTQIGRHAFYGAKKLTLYSESTSVPDGWSARFNSSYRPLVLGCTQDSTFSYIASVQKTDTSLYNYYIEGGISAPRRAGYTFVGWATTQGGTAEFSAAEIYKAPNGTLYAVWKEGEEPEDEDDGGSLWGGDWSSPDVDDDITNPDLGDMD